MTWTLDALDGDTTLLTVNNRLALELRARHDRAQQAAGRPVWTSPDVLPWNAWLARSYTALLDSGFTDLDLLSPAQERLLWRAVIEKDGRQADLLRPAAAAQSAQEAFRLYCEWRLADHPLALLGGDETRVFLTWSRLFTAELERRGLLVPAQLMPLLATAFAQQALPPPRRLVYSGFDLLSPAQEALFDSLRRAGCETIAHGAARGRGECRRVVADDAEGELRLAAAWTHAWLQADPGVRIGIVSPQIAQRRRDLERVFGEVLAPAAYLSCDPAQPPFNLSLGESLADCPLVAHALLALDLLLGEQPLAALGQLLRSPFVGGHAVEWEARALLDAELRDRGTPSLGLAALCLALARPAGDRAAHCPDLAARCTQLARLQRALPASETPSAWAGLFIDALKLLGWPGDAPLDSTEFQQRERLQKVFSEFAALSKVQPRMQRYEALVHLRSLAGDAVFQPESPVVPVQMLGPLEAAGMAFDAVWLLGMDDQTWPPAPKPHPLLPSVLQRRLDMPHASAARELRFAVGLTERLAGSAPRVIASHARSEADREQRPSPLLADWPLVDPDELPVSGTPALRAACAGRAGLEPLPTGGAGPAGAQLHGGAALLGMQAQCPFRAVARFRLQAQPLGEPSFAPDAAMLGNLVHALLQRVWQDLRDSATLAAYDDTALRGLVASHATATLADLGRRRPDLFTPRFRELEAVRLTDLVTEWLEIERARAQAFEVIAVEQEQTVELAGLQLRTRADRVDRLADGSLAVIDYKTGSRVSDQGWFDERLSEPQLPLYCLNGAGEVGAALLARVRHDRIGCRFVGLSRCADVAPGVDTPAQRRAETDWDGLLAAWRRALQDLAAEIRSGRADPTPSRQACEYCPLGALCRVGEMGEENDDEG